MKITNLTELYIVRLRFQLDYKLNVCNPVATIGGKNSF